MKDRPFPFSPAPQSLFDAFRSWLNPETNGILQTSQALAKPTDRPPAHVFGAVRVLVVDDNPVNLMVMSALLQSRGLATQLATDGAEAVALARDHAFDLILMDLQMPVLDGLAATSEIRRFEAKYLRPAVPVVAYTNIPPGASVLAVHGLNGSLAKPCVDHELDDCLVQWCPSYRPAPTLRSAGSTNR